MRTATTEWGVVTVGDDSVAITATHDQLETWATRPNDMWPLSDLRELADGINVVFDARGLVDLDAGRDGSFVEVTADELNAWSSDTLRPVLDRDHPAWFAAVGQFMGESR